MAPCPKNYFNATKLCKKYGKRPLEFIDNQRNYEITKDKICCPGRYGFTYLPNSTMPIFFAWLDRSFETRILEIGFKNFLKEYLEITCKDVK